MNYPVTNSEFYEGKTQINKAKKKFDFENEIKKQNQLTETDQLFESIKKKQLIYLRQKSNIEKLNSIVSELNEAVTLLNDFIFFRNNKFKPTISDDEIKLMIKKPKEKLIKCQNDIYKVGPVGSENLSNLSSVKKSIETNLAQAEEHNLFVTEYLSKSKMIRKTMFSKASWFGIPLN